MRVPLLLPFALCGLFPSGYAWAQCMPGPSQAAFFVDANFSGGCVVLGISDYPTPNAMGIPGDSISSVRIGQNAQAVVCRDDLYGGQCQTITGNIADLTGQPIGNDMISSVIVQARGARIKPSDVFFDPSFVPGSRESPLNILPASPIVAKGVTLRGWLTNGGDGDDCNIDATNHVVPKNGKWQDDNTCAGFVGLEDVHYELIIDYDFIASTYGVDEGVFRGAALHGDYTDSRTTPLPIEDSDLSGHPLGIDINSLWLPYQDDSLKPITLHTELNAWHQRASHWADGNRWHNYAGRGPAPAGWVERDYVAGLGNKASDNWWPFDPDDPEPTGSLLKEGDYVEITGTFWQDSGHRGGDNNPPFNCWGQIFWNHDGQTEIHPVDSLKRVVTLSPWPSPTVDLPGSAKAGVKRVVGVAMCSDGNAAPTYNDSYPQTFCPERTFNAGPPLPSRQPTNLVPHFLEMIDGRFSTLGGVDRGVTGGTFLGDCIVINAKLKPGVQFAHYKATYPVWWTPPQGGPAPTFSLNSGAYTCPLTVSIGDQDPSATIFYTTDGSMPTTSSAKYAGSLTVSNSETLNAIAVNRDRLASGPSGVAYTCSPTPHGCPSGLHCCAEDEFGNCTDCRPNDKPCSKRTCPPGRKCCETDDFGNCTLCVSGGESCP